MKATNPFTATAAAAMLVLAVGCSKQPESAAQSERSDSIRGEPILEVQGEPDTRRTADASEPTTHSAPGGASVVEASALPSAPSPVPGSATETTPQGDPDAPSPKQEAIPTAVETVAAATPPPPSAVSQPEGPGTAPTATADPSPTAPSDEFLQVGFDKLAGFNFEVSEELLTGKGTNGLAALNSADQIPAGVKAFDSKRVAVKGFMLPLKLQEGRVTELLLMRDQSMCCYGSVPKINEWMSVKMVGEGVRPIMDQAVTLFGTLHVGEMREGGYLVGIYRLDGEKMAGPLE